MGKNPHAVALGRKGGAANTPAQQHARAANGRMGGRRMKYRLDAVGVLQRRYHGDVWMVILPPYDRNAREAIRRLTKA